MTICRRSRILLLLASSLVLASCQKRQETVTSPGTREKEPDQVIEGFALTQTTEGVKEWVLRATRAQVYESDQRILVEGVRIEFFREGEKKSSTLTSNRGWVNTLTRDMEAIGHVVLLTPDGGKLVTESLHWSNNQGRVTSDSLVEVTKISGGRKTIMTGRGLETDANLDRVEIKQQVRVYSEPLAAPHRTTARGRGG